MTVEISEVSFVFGGNIRRTEVISNRDHFRALYAFTPRVVSISLSDFTIFELAS